MAKRDCVLDTRWKQAAISVCRICHSRPTWNRFQETEACRWWSQWGRRGSHSPQVSR